MVPVEVRVTDLVSPVIWKVPSSASCWGLPLVSRFWDLAENVSWLLLFLEKVTVIVPEALASPRGPLQPFRLKVAVSPDADAVKHPAGVRYLPALATTVPATVLRATTRRSAPP